MAHRAWPRQFVLGLFLVLAASTVACGADSREDQRAELTVAEFITGWVAASDIAERGLFTAPSVHHLLAPPLACVEGRDLRRPDLMYNSKLMVLLPPNGLDGELFEVVSITSRGSTVAVEIELLYTLDAMLFRGRGGASFEDVMSFSEELVDGVFRTLVLEQVDEDWLIFAVVRESTSGTIPDINRELPSPCILPAGSEQAA